MKKLVSLFVAVAMMLCCVAVASAEDVTLNVAWWGGQGRIDAFESALKLYKEQTGVNIETQTNGFSDHVTSMSTAGASGDLPEMFMLQAAYMGNFVKGEMLVDLYPYIESGALDVSNVSENVLATGVVDGKLYGICAGINAPALIYNKTLLDSNGIEIKDNMTIDEFCALCKEIYEKTGVKTFLSNWTTMIEFLARGTGHHMYENGQLGVDSAEDLLPYFALIERGYNEGWLIDYTVVANASSTEEQPLVNGAEGEYASWCATWYSNQIQALQAAAPEGEELGITTWPSDNLKESNYLRQAMCWCISAQSENIDEAVALLNWWTNSVEAQTCVLGEPGVPANTEVATAITPLLDAPVQKAFTYITDVVTPNCSPANAPSSNGFSEVDVLISELNEMVYSGLMSAQDAAQQLFDEGTAIMAASN